MARASRPKSSAHPNPFVREGDLDCARATVEQATLCNGLPADTAIDLELAILQCGVTFDSSLPGSQQTVLAYSSEITGPYPIVTRLSLETLPDGQWLVRTETFRSVQGQWATVGNVALDLSSSQALAAVALRISPAPADQGGIQ